MQITGFELDRFVKTLKVYLIVVFLLGFKEVFYLHFVYSIVFQVISSLKFMLSC